MLFRDLVLVSRFPQTTRESLRATSHLDETSPFIIHRHSGCTDFDDCAGSTGCATAGDHLNNSNVLLLENWHRRNWIDGCHVDLAAKSSYCSRPSATSHQASEPLHDNTSGVVSRYVRNILVGAICNGRQDPRRIWNGIATLLFDVKEHGDRRGDRPRCSPGDPTLVSAQSFRTWQPGLVSRHGLR